MKRTSVHRDPELFPKEVRRYVADGKLFDSSSSPQATVYYADIEGGYFLKTAHEGALRHEAVMTSYFHGKGLASAVLHYGQWNGGDWLLTARVPGEDCTAAQYLDNPERLATLLGERLHALHELPCADCPVSDLTTSYLTTAERNHGLGRHDLSFYTERYGHADVDDVYGIVKLQGSSLHADVLLHGDYCLPNVILDDWRFGGFVDLDCAGVGDRHVDVFWALWTLRFNLHTDAYGDRFLDAYGRDLIDEERLRTVAAVEVFG